MPTLAVIIGDAIVDVSVAGLTALPAWGRDRSCESVSLLPGGSAANVARQLGSIAAGECIVVFLSTVGDDEAGRFFVRKLATEGTLANPQEDLVVLPSTPQSTCVVLAGPTDRAMVTCYTSVHKLEAASFATHRALGQASIVHFSGYFNCVGLHTEELLEMAVQSHLQACNHAPATDTCVAPLQLLSCHSLAQG